MISEKEVCNHFMWNLQMRKLLVAILNLNNNLFVKWNEYLKLYENAFFSEETE